MSKSTDIHIVAGSLFFLPVTTRLPLKFGSETLTSVTCARARLVVRTQDGRMAEGWGETPLSVQWVWPSSLTYEIRHERLKQFCLRLAKAWSECSTKGHPIEIGHAFQKEVLPGCLETFNREYPESEAMPWLAALVCCSAFDLALHDAYGIVHGVPVYSTYSEEWMSHDLASYLEPAMGSDIDFRRVFPDAFISRHGSQSMKAWHLVGGLDPLGEGDLMGPKPDDGYPVTLEEWIQTDGLLCLKVKLRGNDSEWDWNRLIGVGRIALERGVEWLTADFNCTVQSPEYVNEILDRLRDDHPRIYGMILYVEQPFPYDLEAHRMDVRSVSARKPLFLDESAHDWTVVRLGRELGWTGVALKTCKTQTGAILSACWARAHGMTLMVQDLTNPMLAQISHVQLAAHVCTIMGVETNGMQFYPEASRPEARIHPGIFHRRQGRLDLSTLGDSGFGYRIGEIQRELPEAAMQWEA